MQKTASELKNGVQVLIKLKEAIIVEGKYDKIKLSNFIDGLIITTEGFGVFKDKEKQQLIRRLAQTRGILVMTDSDGAGFVIRNFLKGVVPPDMVHHAYIPDVMGKERRKTSPSKEGKLGVEGLSEELLISCIRRSGVECTSEDQRSRPAGEITKADLFEYGLTGCKNAAENRSILKQKLGLPQNITSNSMLAVLNCLMTNEELEQIMEVQYPKGGNT